MTDNRRGSALGLAATAAVLLLMSACSGAEGDAAQPHSATHTMPDGTVMDGSGMAGEEHHAHTHEAPTTTGPSPAAQMVCTGEVVDDLTRILDLDRAPTPMPSWTDPVFTCTYALDGGPLVLTVHDARAQEVGHTYFRTQRVELGATRELRGMYGLGLPAYETADGTVAFIKDGKTLTVDATALSGRLGPERSMSPSDLAYAVATSVLTCWTKHA